MSYSVVLVIVVFLLLNYLTYLLLNLFVQRKWLSLLLIFAGYYFLVRRVVTYLVFPGCFPIYRRKIEVNLQQQIGKITHDQLHEFKYCLDMYRGQSNRAMNEYSHAQFLAATAK